MREARQRRGKLFIHIGYYKTGTTAIQQALESNRAVLAARGVTYPRSGREHNHLDLALSLVDEQDAPESVIAEARRIREEVDAAEGDVVLSAEGFVRVRPAVLREWCGDANAIIIVYLRDQAEAFASQYQQQVKDGLLSKTFEAFACSAIADHTKFLARWEDAFGRENLRVRAYGESDVVLDFLGLTGIDPTGLEISKTHANPSIAGALLEAKRRINAVFPGTARELLRLSWGWLIELAREQPQYRGRVAATPEFIEAIRARHRECNAVLAETYGLTFSPRPWTAPAFVESDVRAAFDELVRRSPNLAQFSAAIDVQEKT